MRPPSSSSRLKEVLDVGSFSAEGAGAQSSIDWSDVDPDLLASIFAKLPFKLMGTVSLVCKRWAQVAADPFWKPDLVVYAWGDAHVTGLAHACPRPQLLEFSLAQPIVQIACTNEATLALTIDGGVWQWGVWCAKPSRGRELTINTQPTRVRGLRDIAQVACSAPGYYHSRMHYQFLYHCAAVGQDGSLYTWGNCDVGQLAAQPGEKGAALSDDDVTAVAAQLAMHGHVSWVKDPMRVEQFGPRPPSYGGNSSKNGGGSSSKFGGGASVGQPVRRVLHAGCGLHVTILVVETESVLQINSSADDGADMMSEDEDVNEFGEKLSFKGLGGFGGSSSSLASSLFGAGPSLGRSGGSGLSLVNSVTSDHIEEEEEAEGEGEEVEGEEDEFFEEEEEEIAEPLDTEDDRAAFAVRALRRELRLAYRAQTIKGGKENAQLLKTASVGITFGEGNRARVLVPTGSKRPAVWNRLLEAGLPDPRSYLLTPCGKQLQMRAGKILCTVSTVESCGRWYVFVYHITLV
mmetsp:Transcript_32458/g.74768  ORF Transcript_32458/g.74768 Transcript_32458/m.74768 type:complete len:518 (-) Transcript_32458:1511-3064(-)